VGEWFEWAERKREGGWDGYFLAVNIIFMILYANQRDKNKKKILNNEYSMGKRTKD